MTTNRRTFTLYRDTDPTGISGTGEIAEGAIFTDGTAVLRWKPQPTRAAHSSTAVWPDIDSMLGIHGHDGKTRIIWDATNTQPA